MKTDASKGPVLLTPPKPGGAVKSAPVGEGGSAQPAVETKTEFVAPAVHSTVEQPKGNVVPLTSRAKADPLIGASERAPSVSERIPTPRNPPGWNPRQIWQEVIVMDTGHEAARALIGNTDALSRLEGIGFTAAIAVEWRDFFAGIDRVSTERGSPNPSARGRAEFADWVVVQLGGASAGLWKGAAA